MVMVIFRANLVAALFAILFTIRASTSAESGLTNEVIIIEKNKQHTKNTKQREGKKGKGKAANNSKYPKLKDGTNKPKKRGKTTKKEDPSLKDKFWTIADLISITNQPELPYAIGHRGFGQTKDQETVRDIPTENTIESVVKAFQAGVRIVEVDVVITADGDAFVDHDDYLPNYKCLNKLSTKELEIILPKSSTLKNLLDAVRPFAKRKDEDTHPSGLILLEIKAPSPLCDPLDESEVLLFEAVIAAVREAKMTEQVKIQSFSPSILQVARSIAPEIARVSLVHSLQMLSPEAIKSLLNVTAVPVDKNVGLGLSWVEIYPVFRNPIYNSAKQFVEAAAAVGSAELSIHKLILLQMEAASPGAGAAFVAQLQSTGFLVSVFTVEKLGEWHMLASLGVNGIITNFIEEGVALQGD